MDLLPIFLEEYDEPLFDTAAFPTLAVSRLARQHVTVALSGDGGDELFGGYHYYRIIAKLGALYRLPRVLRRLGSNFAGYLPGHKAKLLAGVLKQPDTVAAFAFSRSIAKDFGPLLQNDVYEKTFGLAELFQQTVREFSPNLSPADQAMRLDTEHTLPEDYLQKVDLASMAFSLEARDPLLDQDIVEWAMKLPLSWKLRGSNNKYLLKKLVHRYIPRQIMDRPKKGFEVPLADWLRGPLKKRVDDLLNDKKIFQNIPVTQPVVLDLWNLHCSGKRNAHPLIWAVFVLGEHLRQL